MIAEPAARPSAAAPSFRGRAAAVLLAMRPVHWLKNCFVLAPLLFSRSFHEPGSVEAALWAFLAFCFAASAVYVWNDLRDVSSDRLHALKRHRPLASGALDASWAWPLMALLGAAALAVVTHVPAAAPHLGAYVAINAAYSLGLKRIPWVDLAMLTSGFVLRVYAGAAAIDVELSGWMATATFTLALYLAAWKRHAELLHHGASVRPALAHYRPSQLRTVAMIAGLAALGCYVLFIALVRPMLWPTLVPVAAGLPRYGWLALRRGGGDSPFALIVRDPLLLLATFLWAGGTLAALW